MRRRFLQGTLAAEKRRTYLREAQIQLTSFSFDALSHLLNSPYGETNKTVIKYLEDKHHLHVVQWSDNNVSVFLDFVRTVFKILGGVDRSISDALSPLFAVSLNLLQGDADGDTPETSIEMYKTFKAGERHLILGHEVKEPTVGQIIPFALDYFKKLDVTPVSLQDCLKGHPSPYKAIGKYQKRDE